MKHILLNKKRQKRQIKADANTLYSLVDKKKNYYFNAKTLTKRANKSGLSRLVGFTDCYLRYNTGIS